MTTYAITDAADRLYATPCDASLILEDRKLLQNERKVHDKLLADIQHDIVQKFTTEFVTVTTLTLGYGNTGVDGSK